MPSPRILVILLLRPFCLVRCCFRLFLLRLLIHLCFRYLLYSLLFVDQLRFEFDTLWLCTLARCLLVVALVNLLKVEFLSIPVLMNPVP